MDAGAGLRRARTESHYWRALHETRDFNRADRLHRETGELPDNFMFCLWLAGCYGLRDDPA